MAAKVLAVRVAAKPPVKKDDVAYTAHDHARVRLARALARQSALRLECVQSALVQVRRECIGTSALDRVERDIENVLAELREIEHEVGFALVCKPY